MNQFGLQYIYTWKCFKETPYVIILNKQKCHFSFLLENCRTSGWNRSCLGEVGTSGREEDMEKGCRRVTIVQILCTRICKWEVIPVETIPAIGEGEIKENDEGVNSNMIYLIHCKNFCKFHNVFPSSTITNKQTKKKQRKEKKKTPKHKEMTRWSEK
jgi:hypothetical protein